MLVSVMEMARTPRVIAETHRGGDTVTAFPPRAVTEVGVTIERLFREDNMRQVSPRTERIAERLRREILVKTRGYP
jgi:hypothetical protein